MEDMLIARVKSVTVVRWTKGRQLSYQDHIVNFHQNHIVNFHQDHIVNFHQDITEIATKLPCLSEEVDMIVIRKEDVVLDQHVDFIVRREKVRAALQYKIAHDPHYADLILDNDALNQLPENGSVAHRVSTCIDRSQGAGPATPVGPHAAAEGEEADNDNEDDQVVGGVINLEMGERLKVEQVRAGAESVIRARPYEQIIVRQI